MSLAEELAADRRGVILDLLMREPGYKLSDDVLRLSLKGLGRGAHRVTVIQAELGWLAEHGLVRIEKDHSDGVETQIGVLTRAGKEVAEGAPHPGVRRPEPR
ncbi:hypothetical protein VQH23_07480 [Pararoseomonas sp. SCSIO 73927]|uniref:hypothetical protein n=1 Tax=Pararoseomonas sp. SCSIO 73927 TaxID=3114537 RepID=UPI0030D0142E